jgi:hypothetical protein
MCLYLTVLFQKLIKQHRVHLIIADAVRFSFLIAHNQLRIDFCHFFGHKTELRSARRISFLLVTEGNRFESEQRSAGFVHRFDIFLKALRGSGRAKFTICINEDANPVGRGCAEDMADIAAATDICADGANTDNVTGCRDIRAGIIAQGNVAVAAGAIRERSTTDGRVTGASVLLLERRITVSCIVVRQTAAEQSERIRIGLTDG